MIPFYKTTNTKLFYLCVLLFVLLNFIIVSQVNGQSVTSANTTTKSIPYQDISSGSLYFKHTAGYLPALTQNSDYQVQVNGLLARVNFSQSFKNTSDDFVEAVYVFPLINDAAVDSMVMEIGERRIVGKIKEKQQALKLYKKAKQQGKKASLVSQQRPNLFTTKLANIAPGETIKVNISYVQSVKLKDEIFSLRIPLTLTPRYIPTPSHTRKLDTNGWAVANTRVPDADKITPLQMRVNNTELHMQTVSLDVNLQTGLPIAQINSLYHPIKQYSVPTQQFNDGKASQGLAVTLADKKVLLDQDFVLQWQLSQGNTPKAAFFSQTKTATDDDYHYGLLMVMPPKASQVKAIDKEVVYIIDRSGSMGGVAIRQAKQALKTALALLKPTDSFNIIAFDSHSDSLFSQSKRASTTNIATAEKWLSEITAGGGTNMYPAIARALAVTPTKQSIEQPHNKSSYRQVVFITDGSVGNEDELLLLIENNLANTRLHTIGIGSAPNGYFMTQAAKVGRGTYRYIGNISEVQQQMTQLFSQISKPLMTNIQVNWPQSSVEMFPQQLPDLYAGEPLVISARWLKSPHQSLSPLIRISGELAQAKWLETIEIDNSSQQAHLMKNKQVDNSISQWWARNKIKHLNLLKRRSTSAEQARQLTSNITRLALKHQLVSPFTSFVAVEQQVSRKGNLPLTTTGVKNLMPKGSTQAIPLAKTALGLAGYFYMSLLLVSIAFVIHLITMRVDKTC
ncbi:marine proteobacterial sortase target protein [Colwellia sp. KU-HH00111]|uniref:marine proteobacterial sortase target protein n=1 Tax=Colwellia sp. KU-HH00111 TaxID=3127652 RepID=UPI0031068987